MIRVIENSTIVLSTLKKFLYVPILCIAHVHCVSIFYNRLETKKNQSAVLMAPRVKQEKSPKDRIKEPRMKLQKMEHAKKIVI